MAFAYEACNGERFKITQAYAEDLLKTLKALQDMSCRRLAKFFADCNHILLPGDLAECYIAMPMATQ
jgi:hypothetical protein